MSCADTNEDGFSVLSGNPKNLKTLSYSYNLKTLSYSYMHANAVMDWILVFTGE